MKQGFIVWNQTNYGDGFEFFGVFRSYQEAKKHLRRVFKKRYGKDYYKLTQDEVFELENGEDMFLISSYELNDGSEE